MTGTDRSRVIFGNVLDDSDYRSACRNKAGFVRKFGNDTADPYPLAAVEAPVIGERWGVMRLVGAAEDGAAKAGAEAAEAGANGANTSA